MEAEALALRSAFPAVALGSGLHAACQPAQQGISFLSPSWRGLWLPRDSGKLLGAVKCLNKHLSRSHVSPPSPGTCLLSGKRCQNRAPSQGHMCRNSETLAFLLPYVREQQAGLHLPTCLKPSGVTHAPTSARPPGGPGVLLMSSEAAEVLWSLGPPLSPVASPIRTPHSKRLPLSSLLCRPH